MRPLVDGYLAQLTIAPVNRARLVNVSFESEDPKLAAKILNAHAKVFIEPKELAETLATDKSVRLVDVRSREEYDAVHIPDSVLLSQDVMRQIMAEGSDTRPLVIIDHQGNQGLDAATYFMGHGLQNVRCLRGGIDAWAREIDTKMRRYKID